jgi:hypothetical protein
MKFAVVAAATNGVHTPRRTRLAGVQFADRAIRRKIILDELLVELVPLGLRGRGDRVEAESGYGQYANAHRGSTVSRRILGIDILFLYHVGWTFSTAFY